MEAFAFSIVIGCTPGPKSDGSSGPAGSSSAPPGTLGDAPNPPGAAGVTATGDGGAPTAAASDVEVWTGKYESEPGSLYVVDGGEWAGVTWRGDDAGVGLGEGAVTLTVNRKTGEVHGTADGAIGDALLVGSVAEDTVTASVLRKDPRDRGLTGTAVAKVSGGSISGSMKLSVANARVLREAKFTLAAKP